MDDLPRNTHLIAFHDKQDGSWLLGRDTTAEWTMAWTTCPSCKKFVIFLLFKDFLGNSRSQLVYPKAISRSPVPPEVSKEIADDYKEACLVLTDSEKASAALSRRCLQTLLRQKAGVKHGDLSNEIQQVLDSGKLPSHLADQIDTVRVIGNFAAHPIKSKSTGEIVKVESGEAEWLLDTLEGLFDFYFVQPAKTQKKRDALNKKLQEAGKPLLKTKAE